MNKILIFLLLILTFLGVIGGIGCTLYDGAYAITVGLMAAGYVAWPKFRELFRKLTE